MTGRTTTYDSPTFETLPRWAAPIPPAARAVGQSLGTRTRRVVVGTGVAVVRPSPRAAGTDIVAASPPRVRARR